MVKYQKQEKETSSKNGVMAIQVNVGQLKFTIQAKQKTDLKKKLPSVKHTFDAKELQIYRENQSYVRKLTLASKSSVNFSGQNRHVDAETRLHLIYLNQVHGKKLYELVKEFGIKYTTVLTIVHGFTKDGRIRQLLHPRVKRNLLEHRVADKRALKLYKQFKKQRSNQHLKNYEQWPQYRWCDPSELEQFTGDQSRMNSVTGSNKSVDQPDTSASNLERSPHTQNVCSIGLAINGDQMILASTKQGVTDCQAARNRPFNRAAIFQENEFTDVNQRVESSVKLVVGNDDSATQMAQSYYHDTLGPSQLFSGPLHHFNCAFIRGQWLMQPTVDFLKLPEP